MSVTRKKLQINGMTCVNCQSRIEKKLSETSGIIKAKVSYNKGTADIAYDTDEISQKEVIRVIENLGYRVVTGPQGKAVDLERVIAYLILIVSFYVLLQQFGILNLLVPNQLADSRMGYGMLFVVGLLTSVHCIAMCGGINLSCCLPKPAASKRTDSGFMHKGGAQNGEQTKADRISAFVPAFAYNAGRVVSYTVIGMILGFAGMLLGGGSGGGLSAFFQGIIKLIAGVFMVIMGVNMLELFGWMKKFSLRMPRFFASAVGRKKRNGGGPFFIGLLNGLMPCGPLQSMQIVALASGNPITGSLSMFFFSLGTVPLMLGFGSLVAALGKKFTQTVMRVGAVLVAVLGLAMLSQGVSLTGLLTANQLVIVVVMLCVLGVIASAQFSKKIYKQVCVLAACAFFVAVGMFWRSSGAFPAQIGGALAGSSASIAESSAAAAENSAGSQTAAQTETEDGVQVVNSTLSVGKYPNITVTAGVPVKWIINAPVGSINGCNYKMLIRQYGIEHTFQEGENVIEFTPDEAGTVTYTCWMGMIRGNIFVAEAVSAAVGQEDSSQQAAGSDGGVPGRSSYQIPTEELAVAQKAESEDGAEIQSVEITLTQDGFSPAVVVVENGVQTNWLIRNERSADEELLAALYSTTLPLDEGENMLYLYPVESFDVSTGDGEFFAYVKVVDDLQAIDADAIRSEVEAYELYVYPSSAFEGVQTGGSCCY